MELRDIKNYAKRFAFVGTAFIFIVVVVLVASENVAISGCTGDCMSCHQKLENEENHTALKICITCHNPAKPRISLMASTVGCGDRCFTCHISLPKDSAHETLSTCLNCHER